MHYIIQGILFYFGIVILQIAIFTFVIGLIALGEYLYKKYQEMERERVQRQRMEYLRKNTEKSQYIEDTANTPAYVESSDYENDQMYSDVFADIAGIDDQKLFVEDLIENF